MSKDGYNINEPPVGSIRPAIPPKAPPPVPAKEYRVIMNNDPPLLPSERRLLEQKIKEERQKYELAYDTALRKFTRIINESDLTVEQKEAILSQVWE